MATKEVSIEVTKNEGTEMESTEIKTEETVTPTESVNEISGEKVSETVMESENNEDSIKPEISTAAVIEPEKVTEETTSESSDIETPVETSVTIVSEEKQQQKIEKVSGEIIETSSSNLSKTENSTYEDLCDFIYKEINNAEKSFLSIAMAIYQLHKNEWYKIENYKNIGEMGFEKFGFKKKVPVTIILRFARDSESLKGTFVRDCKQNIRTLLLQN